MPITLTATIGSASANSYVTLPEAAAYFETRLNAEAWTDAGDEGEERQKIALIEAARWLEHRNWLGSRVNDTQALAWPRWNITKPDNAGGGTWRGLVTDYGEQYESTEIAQRVKDAQCEMALALLDGFDIESGIQFNAVSRGGFSSAVRTTTVPPRVQALIAPLMAGNEIWRG